MHEVVSSCVIASSKKTSIRDEDILDVYSSWVLTMCGWYHSQKELVLPLMPLPATASGVSLGDLG